jgi:diaminopimelate epimerase
VQWGLVPAGTREITVHMDGGDARVRVGDEVILVGPATFIATIEVP